MAPFAASSDSVGNSSKISITTGGLPVTLAGLAGTGELVVSTALAWSSPSEAHEATTSAAPHTVTGSSSHASPRRTGGTLRSGAGENLLECGGKLESAFAGPPLHL